MASKWPLVKTEHLLLPRDTQDGDDGHRPRRGALRTAIVVRMVLLTVVQVLMGKMGRTEVMWE